jgi:hypothetical protein
VGVGGGWGEPFFRNKGGNRVVVGEGGGGGGVQFFDGFPMSIPANGKVQKRWDKLPHRGLVCSQSRVDSFPVTIRPALVDFAIRLTAAAAAAAVIQYCGDDYW